jgi:glutamyl-tRNA synthetase
MGYPPADDETEVCSFDQFVADFDWAKVNTVGPVFDMKKLDWLNGHYIRSLSESELADRIIAYISAYQADQVPGGLDERSQGLIRAAVPLIAPRLTILKEALEKVRFLLVPDKALEVEEKARAKVDVDAAAVLPATIAVLETVPFEAEAIQEALTARLVDDMGYKKKVAFAPIRVAITGSLVSPPLFESMEILGRESSLARLRQFVA